MISSSHDRIMPQSRANVKGIIILDSYIYYGVLATQKIVWSITRFRGAKNISPHPLVKRGSSTFQWPGVCWCYSTLTMNVDGYHLRYVISNTTQLLSGTIIDGPNSMAVNQLPRQLYQWAIDTWIYYLQPRSK